MTFEDIQAHYNNYYSAMVMGVEYVPEYVPEDGGIHTDLRDRAEENYKRSLVSEEYLRKAIAVLETQEEALIIQIENMPTQTEAFQRMAHSFDHIAKAIEVLSTEVQALK